MENINEQSVVKQSCDFHSTVLYIAFREPELAKTEKSSDRN